MAFIILLFGEMLRDHVDPEQFRVGITFGAELASVLLNFIVYCLQMRVQIAFGERFSALRANDPRLLFALNFQLLAQRNGSLIRSQILVLMLLQQLLRLARSLTEVAPNGSVNLSIMFAVNVKQQLLLRRRIGGETNQIIDSLVSRHFGDRELAKWTFPSSIVIDSIMLQTRVFGQ